MAKRTVFVIGAGAGSDIGMCLGSTLMAEIASDVNFHVEGGQLVRGNGAVYAALGRVSKSGPERQALFLAGRQIASGIRTSGSIDNYIHNHRNNAAIKTVGKIAVINTILKYERKCKVFTDQTKHPLEFLDPAGLELFCTKAITSSAKSYPVPTE
jgi:superfamily II DNA or RNA helicase